MNSNHRHHQTKQLKSHLFNPHLAGLSFHVGQPTYKMQVKITVLPLNKRLKKISKLRPTQWKGRGASHNRTEGTSQLPTSASYPRTYAWLSGQGRLQFALTSN